jgi:hypothetical protein
VVVLAVALAGTAACLPAPQARVRQGQTYVSGNGSYDAFFREVNAVQREGQGWEEERLAGRKALASELEVAPDAPDATLAQRTFEKASQLASSGNGFALDFANAAVKVRPHASAKGEPRARAFWQALEQTASAEVARSERLRALAPRIEQALATAQTLKPRVDADFARQGGQKPAEVRAELDASIEVLTVLGDRARAAAKGAVDLVADLQRAVLAAHASHETHAPSPPPQEEPAAPAPKPNPPKAGRSEPVVRGGAAPATKPSGPKPVRPSGGSESTQKPTPTATKPPPKPAEAGEVFNP